MSGVQQSAVSLCLNEGAKFRGSRNLCRDHSGTRFRRGNARPGFLLFRQWERRRRWGGGGGPFALLCWSRYWGCFGSSAGPRAIRERLAADSQEEFPSIAAAVSGDGGELFAMPLHDDLGSNVDRRFETDAGTGPRGVLESSSRTIGRTALVLPADFGHRPQCRSWLNVTAVHAMCIGGVDGKFSTCGEKQPSFGRPVRVLDSAPQKPQTTLEEAHESRGWKVGGEKVRVFQASGSG